MKIYVKTLKGTNFAIEVNPTDTVADLKKSIETAKGSEIYPAGQQMLIRQGKVLKDETSLEENKVTENSFVVIMLSKNKASSGGASTTSTPQSSTPQPASITSLPTGPGIPEQAEVPVLAQPPAIAQPVNVNATQPVPPSSGPNSSPLDLFPQGFPTVGPNASSDTSDFIRTIEQFQVLKGMVQSNPQLWEPMLQELGNQYPQSVQFIQEHPDLLSRLVDEPFEGKGNISGQLAEETPGAITITVTPEEWASIQRLEAMGFDRALVLEVFFACNKDEELAASYLIDHQM